MSTFIEKNIKTPKIACNTCRYHKKGTLKCKAFPKGIPSSIVMGDNKHTKPLKGQENDIVYEKE